MVGAQVDPQITDINNNDYALRDSSPCASKGAGITSPSSLLAQSDPLEKPPSSFRFFPQIFGQVFR
jgi:hypothetical protein